MAIIENTISGKVDGFRLTHLATLFTGLRMSHIMEVFWLCKKYVSKKKMPLKHLKIDHVEYYAYVE